VEKKLLEVAQQHPLVLRKPEPTVVFSAFGDSTLNFELRLHVPNREVFAQIQHEINMQIDRAFRSAEIEIAFPQRELHIRPSSMAVVQQALLDSQSPESLQPQKQNSHQIPKAA
jgi:potassium efflux system protein